jgi:anthranilate 1,2-dioxygenase large subunit
LRESAARLEDDIPDASAGARLLSISIDRLQPPIAAFGLLSDGTRSGTVMGDIEEARADVGLGRNDFSRVPFAHYISQEIFDREHERIFNGPVWHYLALEAEIPDAGDYVATYVGTIPVVINRTRDGRLAGFVNRCAHRGATVVRKVRGNQILHTCIYHQWSYDADGHLTGVPYRRGLGGKGGFPSDFVPQLHCLRKLKVASYCGVIFGTFDETAPLLEDYLGETLCARLTRFFGKPVRVLGYQRQHIRANWKMMVENVKDCYHGGLLHAFNSKYGFFRSTQRGEVALSGGGLHSVLTIFRTENEEITGSFDKVSTYKPQMKLEDDSILRSHREFDDEIASCVISVFPSFLLIHGGNFMAFRHVRPKSPGEFEMVWTHFGYTDDSASLTDLRLRQINFIGSAGYISMEDAEALEMVQKAVSGERSGGEAVLALGGRAVRDEAHLVTETAIRGFWKGYTELMGLAQQP